MAARIIITLLVGLVAGPALAQKAPGELWATSPDGLAQVYREADGYGVRVHVVNEADTRVKVHVSLLLWFGDRPDPIRREGIIDAAPGKTTAERYGDGPGFLGLTRHDGDVRFVDAASPPGDCEVTDLELRPVSNATLLLVQFRKGGAKTTINPERLAEVTDGFHKAGEAAVAATTEIPIRTGPIDFDAPTNPTKVGDLPALPPDTLWTWRDARGAPHYVTARDVARLACGTPPPEQSAFHKALGTAKKALMEQLKALAEELCREEPESDACKAARQKSDSMGGFRG